MVKDLLKQLKNQKVKILNKHCKTEEDFEERKYKLNELELKMLELNYNHIPHID